MLSASSHLHLGFTGHLNPMRCWFNIVLICLQWGTALHSPHVSSVICEGVKQNAFFPIASASTLQIHIRIHAPTSSESEITLLMRFSIFPKYSASSA